MRSRFVLAAVLLLALLLPAPTTRAKEDEIDLDEVLFTIDEVTGDRRVRLIRALCKMNDPLAADGLVRVLAQPKPSDNADIQDTVYKALYRLRSRAIVPDLTKMLETGSEAQQVYALKLLGRTIGPKAFDLIRPHMKAEGVVLTAAIKAMGETRDPRAADLLRETLKRVGPRSDASVFVRMSLIRLGDTKQFKPLIERYQRIMDEAFTKKNQMHYVDSPIRKKRLLRRVKRLWSLQRELRAYFNDLAPDLLPPLVQAVETTEADAPKQIVFDMAPRMMDRKRAPQFAAMLTSRYIAMRQLIVEEYLRLGDPQLRDKAVESVRKYLGSEEWPDRRYAIMYSSLLPRDERMSALRKAAKDEVVWVRAEAVRELGRIRTDEALALIREVRDATQHEELRFICRCALAGIEEDLYGIR